MADFFFLVWKYHKGCFYSFMSKIEQNKNMAHLGKFVSWIEKNQARLKEKVVIACLPYEKNPTHSKWIMFFMNIEYSSILPTMPKVIYGKSIR